MQKTQVHSLGRKDNLEKEVATHSSILAWRIPWTELFFFNHPLPAPAQHYVVDGGYVHSHSPFFPESSLPSELGHVDLGSGLHLTSCEEKY